MNNQSITFIMPAYNAATTINEAIQSLKKQDSDNWYLIIVDDGSTDNTKDIVREAAEEDMRIRLVIQVNQGPAVARANAITNVRTEYIAILDADDLLSRDYVRLLLKKAHETNADIVVPNVKCIDQKGRIEESSHFNRQKLSQEIVVEDGQKAFEMSISWKLHGWVMIKTELAIKYYTFDNVCYSKFNSDEYISRYLYLKSNKVVLADAIYFYRHIPTSITHHFSAYHFDRILTLDHLANLCINEHISMETTHKVYSIYRCHINQSLLLYKLHFKELKNKRKVFLVIMNTYKKSYKKNFPSKLFLYVGLKEKFKYALSLSGFTVIQLIADIRYLMIKLKRYLL